MPQLIRVCTRIALLSAALHAGCDGGVGQSQTKVYGSVELLDHTTPALTNVGDLVAVDGVYGEACQYRSTSGGFTLPIHGSRSTLGTGLAVRYGDAGCTLQLTSLEALDPAGVSRLYALEPPLLLDQEFKAMATGCRSADRPIAFFMNARLRSSALALFTSDYVIDLIYSDDPLRIDAYVQAQFATVQALVQATGVPVPDYVADASSLRLKVDAQGKLAGAASGQLSLMGSPNAAQKYVLVSADPGDTAVSIDAMYQASSQAPISAAPLTLTAAELGLSAGVTLPVTRYLILANYLSSDPSTRSYQVFRFQFLRP